MLLAVPVRIGAIAVVAIMDIEFSLHAERSVIFIIINAGQRLIT